MTLPEHHRQTGGNLLYVVLPNRPIPLRRFHGMLHPGAWRRDPVAANYRQRQGDLSYGTVLADLCAARLFKSAVLPDERSTGNEYVSGLHPANLRVNPIAGRRNTA
jgi:hypothetical protein